MSHPLVPPFFCVWGREEKQNRRKRKKDDASQAGNGETGPADSSLSRFGEVCVMENTNFGFRSSVFHFYIE